MDGWSELGRRRGREGSQAGGCDLMRWMPPTTATAVQQLVVGVCCGVANNSKLAVQRPASFLFGFSFP